MANLQQASFTGGEISPNLYNRVDLARWFNSLKVCRNFITMPYGGLKNRPGLEFTVEAKDSTRKVRVVEFQPRASQGYAIEFGHLYLRITKNGAPVYAPFSGIAAYAAGTTYTKNTMVSSSGLAYRSLQDTNLAHTPAGSPTWWEQLPIVTVSGVASVLIDLITTYTESELFDLRFSQSVDVMTITHSSHQNTSLSHYSDADWRLAPVVNESGPWLELNLDSTISMSVDKSAVGAAVVVKASAPVFDSAKHTGRLLYIEQRGYGKPWEVQKSITVGDIRRSDGKYYQAQNTATTGTLRPVHTQDTWFDGDAGVNWLYLHSGYGIARINSVTDSTHANATIVKRMPDELSSTGTGYGTLVNLAGATYSDNGAGFIRVTKAGHGVPLTPLGPCRLTVSGSTYEAYMMVVTANTIDISWFSYNDFAAYIHTIDSIEPPATAGSLASTRWKFGAWGGDQGWPAQVFYFQGRRGYAASVGQPGVVWLTRTNAYNDFSVSTPLIDTDALTFPLSSGKLDAVQGVLSMDKLVMLTEGAEWALGTGRDDVATPGNSTPKQQGYRGAHNLQPLLIGDSGLFVQSKGTIVRDVDYDISREKYVGNDLTVFSDHLFEGRSVVAWAYQQHPTSNVWLVMDDGALLGLTYMREQQVLGWHRHDSDGDTFESVCCVGESGEDAVYVVVRRLVNGVYKRYIERLHTRLVTSIEQAFFVDSGLSYDGTTHRNIITPGDDFTICTVTITGGAAWDETEQLTLIASQPMFQGASDVGDAINFDGLGDGLFYRCSIESFISTTQVKVRPNQALSYLLQNSPRSDWKLARNTFSLPHLVGRTVSVLADGNSMGSYTVGLDGLITIDPPGVVVHAGLPIVADVQTLSVTVQNTEPMVNKKKSIPNVSVQVLESRGLKAGRDFDHLRMAKERTPFESFDTPAKLMDGIVTIPIDTPWGTDGSICIRQDEPLPLTITAILPEVVLGSL